MRAFAAHNIKERLIKLFDCLHFLNENLIEAEPKEQIELDEHFESSNYILFIRGNEVDISTGKKVMIFRHKHQKKEKSRQ